jgi:hypothetical protein
MNATTLNLNRLLCAALLPLLFGAQLNCSHSVPTPSLAQATTQSASVCYDDGIGCGTPKLGAVHIGLLFNALPAQTTALMYANAQQAMLQVDRIGTYWDWFMDHNGNYSPAGPYLQQLDAQIARDFDNGVTPEFLLGTEAPNSMPGLPGPDNLPNWTYYPSEEAAFNALADILANLVARFPTVKYWELFNEMDSAGFTTLFTGAGQASCPNQRGQIYGQMLNVVVPAARRVNPSIHILMGGMGAATDVLENSSFSSACGISLDFDTGLPQTMAGFLVGIYSAGAGTNFDIVNAHAYADSTYSYGNPADVNIDPRFRAISASLHQVVLAQRDTSKQFWITESGTSGADDVNSGTCGGNSGLGSCIDQAQVNVLGSVVNDLMQNHLFDVAIIYAVCAGSGGTPNSSYNQYLLEGTTVNDYGYQILRSDDTTLRPMFSWLIQRNDCLSQGGSMFTTNWNCQN